MSVNRHDNTLLSFVYRTLEGWDFTGQVGKARERTILADPDLHKTLNADCRQDPFFETPGFSIFQFFHFFGFWSME